MKFLFISAILLGFLCSIHAATVDASEISRRVADEAVDAQNNGMEEVLDGSVKEEMEEEMEEEELDSSVREEMEEEAIDGSVKETKETDLDGTTNRSKIILKRICKLVRIGHKVFRKCILVKCIRKCIIIKVIKHGRIVLVKKCKLIPIH